MDGEVGLLSNFSDVTFIEGRPASTDEFGKPYVTVSICGLVPEGGLVPSVVNMADWELEDFFYAALRKVIGGRKFVVVRKWPTLESRVDAIDDWDTSRTSDLLRKKITGRFSFYLEDPRANTAASGTQGPTPQG